MIWLRRAVAIPLALVFIILALLVLVAFRVNATTAQPMIDQSLTSGFGQTDGIATLMAQKGVTLGQNAIGSFISGLRNQAIAIVIASVILVGGGVVLHNWDKIRKS